MSLILLYLPAACLLCQTLGVHFYTLPGQQMCFHQHMAAEVALAVKYTKITQLMMKGASDVDMELQYAQATRELYVVYEETVDRRPEVLEAFMIAEQGLEIFAEFRTAIMNSRRNSTPV
ncbi:hypothetical protein FOZ61_001764 [Perkinsus olseni]|uniref:Uncharacterized protein n=1 Tax=Perkinsus olseni TaxID=32597 RepID=A0A7J6KRD9_PEROL|nr:hypothetical protein FOZ61_001764 [Perkinsus olseni]